VTDPSGIDPLVEGPRTRLRALHPSEYRTVFAWYNDPELVSPFDRFSLDTFEGFVQDVESASDDPRSLAPRFVIERREDGRLLGLLGHFTPHPVLSTVEVWYVMGAREERGKGYGSEAVRLLVDHLFRVLPIERVGAVCDAENVPSVHLLERVGLSLEGTLHRALFHHAVWHDVRVYGVTRSAWASRPTSA